MNDTAKQVYAVALIAAVLQVPEHLHPHVALERAEDLIAAAHLRAKDRAKPSLQTAREYMKIIESSLGGIGSHLRTAQSAGGLNPFLIETLNFAEAQLLQARSAYFQVASLIEAAP